MIIGAVESGLADFAGPRRATAASPQAVEVKPATDGNTRGDVADKITRSVPVPAMETNTPGVNAFGQAVGQVINVRA